MHNEDIEMRINMKYKDRMKSTWKILRDTWVLVVFVE